MAAGVLILLAALLQVGAAAKVEHARSISVSTRSRKTTRGGLATPTQTLSTYLYLSLPQRPPTAR